LDLKDLLNTSSGPFEETITAERVSKFCHAVGASRTDEVPPTFLTLFRRAEFELFDKLGIPLQQVLHTEQSYELREPMRAGDRLVYTTRLARALEKRGGAASLKFLTFETAFAAERGESRHELGTATTQVVIRGEAA
jgi:hypothetical protein